MDRRTGDAKQIGRALAERLRQDVDGATRVTELEYFRAGRCRICQLDNQEDLPNAIQV